MISEMDPSVQISSPGRITAALVSAVLEWLLILMLFIDANFSYLVTKFARYCHLEFPCLLCSRLDHVLGGESSGFVWDLICYKHKLDISSLIFCRIHNKLIDVHDTCESCFFSFATINKSNSETYRLLVGKLGTEGSCRKSDGDSSSLRKCCCCNDQFVSRSLHSSIANCKYEKEEVHETAENSNTNHLPHVEYKKVKVTSDTESETPFSDTESAGARMSPPEVEILSPAVAQLINPAPSFSSLIEPDENVFNSLIDVESKAAPLEHGLDELKWDHTHNVSTLSRLVSINEEDIPPSFDINRDELKKTVITCSAEIGKEDEINKGEDSKRVVESRKSIPELLKEITEEYEETSHSHMSNSLELGDAYKLALGTKSRQLSGRLLDHQKSITEDSTRASEDLKLLLSQLSASRGVELSINDDVISISPRLVSGHTYEDYKSMEVSPGSQMLQSRISLERNESNISLDASSISDIEGESAVDRLKRQLEHDKKIISALYKELEEERNASAIAANQAMAMITRLQEEKATLNMEALQFLRMMEEQAEYDSEALIQATDMLVEKDRQIQDFEDELNELKFKNETYEENLLSPKMENFSEAAGE